jgi:hypothetical protein
MNTDEHGLKGEYLLQGNDGAHGVTRPTAHLLFAACSKKNFPGTRNSICDLLRLSRDTRNKFRAPLPFAIHPCSSVFSRG